MAWAAAAAQVAGDAMNFFGQRETNIQNWDIAQAQMAFQKDMATNAMQYRVADLKKAGLNPYLAVGGGTATGAQAMPGAAIPMQNPAASFQNLGQGVASAMQLQTLQSEIEKNNAQAKQASSQGDYTAGALTGLTQAQQAETTARANLSDATRTLLLPAQAAQANAGAQLSTAERDVAMRTLDEITAKIANIHADTALKAIDQAVEIYKGQAGQLSVMQQRLLMPFVVGQASVALDLGKLSLPEAKALSNYWSSKWGAFMPYQNQVQSGISSAAQLIKSFMPGGGQGGVPQTMQPSPFNPQAPPQLSNMP